MWNGKRLDRVSLSLPENIQIWNCRTVALKFSELVPLLALLSRAEKTRVCVFANPLIEILTGVTQAVSGVEFSDIRQ